MMTITFLWPVVLILLPLPILVYRLIKPTHSAQTVTTFLRIPTLPDFLKTQSRKTGQPFSIKTAVLLAFSWVFFIIALTRPVGLGEVQSVPQTGRHTLLAMDVSGSMSESDFDFAGKPAARIDIVKKLAADFIHDRAGDTIGVILFGSEPYVFIPPTTDTKTSETLLAEAGVGIAGEMTAMGDAITLAVKSLQSVPADKRVLILLSDGYHNAGAVSIEDALQLAKQAHVKIYTIGIGADVQTIQTLFGNIPFYPASDLDEDTLRYMAESTGGRYFRAHSTTELRDVYTALNELEKIDTKADVFRPQKELFYVPLILSLALLISAFYTRRQS